MVGLLFAYPRQAIWEQIRPAVLQGNQMLNSLNLPVDRLLYRGIKSACKKEVLSGLYILFLLREKPSAIALTFGAVSVFTIRGLYDKFTSKKGPLQATAADLIGDGRQSRQLLGKAHFKTFVSWFDPSQNILDYEIESKTQQNEDLRAEVGDADTEGLQQHLINAQKIDDGELLDDAHVNPVRLASGVPNSAGTPARDKAPEWKEALERKIHSKEVESQALEAKIAALRLKKDPSLNTCRIEDIAVVTLGLWVASKFPVVGWIVEAVAVVGCLVLGGLGGSLAYQFAIEPDTIEA